MGKTDEIINNLKQELEVAKKDKQRATQELEDYKSEVGRRELDAVAAHRRVLDDKEHEMKHFKDDEVKKLKEKADTLEKEKAVLAKELEITKKSWTLMPTSLT